MPLPDREQYKVEVYNAFSGSDLVIASVIPEEDYIEAVCTKCGKIEIYRYSEIGNVRCSECHKNRMKSRFENAYLGMISAFMVASDSITRSLVEIVELRKRLNERLAHKGIKKTIDPWFSVFKEQYHCPVCQYPHRRMAQICTVCGFEYLHKKFDDSEDALEWERRTIEPLRRKYIRMQNKWFLEDGI